jgi:hypothetical protein
VGSDTEWYEVPMAIAFGAIIGLVFVASRIVGAMVYWVGYWDLFNPDMYKVFKGNAKPKRK